MKDPKEKKLALKKKEKKKKENQTYINKTRFKLILSLP